MLSEIFMAMAGGNVLHENLGGRAMVGALGAVIVIVIVLVGVKARRRRRRIDRQF